MADEKDEIKKELKDLEEQLFKEFNEQINLSEPSDSRLQDNVDLNPEKLDTEKDQVSEEVIVKAPDSEKPDEIDLGSAFSSFVASEQVEEALAREEEKKRAKEVKKEKLIDRLVLELQKMKPKVVDAIRFSIQHAKNFFVKAVAVIKKPFLWFQSLTKRDKIFFIVIKFMVALCLLSAYYFYHEVYLKMGKSPYLQNFSELSGTEYTYDTNEDFEDFFSPAVMPDYIYILPKIITNLKPSANSGSNPMIFIEVVLKASNQQTAVELKDRELNMKDQAARTLEGFSFDQMQSNAGKEQLKKDLENNLNLLLNSGNVKSVLFKSFIIKP